MEADRLLMSEKNTEISSMRNKLEILTACQQDFLEEITSYKDENLKLTGRIDELEKENQSLRVKANLDRTFTVGSSFTETPEKFKNLEDNLRSKLKRSENYVEHLEAKLDEENTRIGHLEKELENLKYNINFSSAREGELLKELQKYEEDKLNLQSVIQDKDEILKKLEQEIEDYK